VRTVELGQNGPRVGAIGLGTFGMSGAYGPADDGESIRTIHMAIDNGVSLIDTGDFYGMGHSEELIRRALSGRKRDQIVLSVKFGMLRAPDGKVLGFDGRPSSVKTFLTYSLQRLGVDHIDIYRPARVDPNVPIEETIGAIDDMVEAGYVRHAGLSETPLEAIDKALGVSPICDVQLEYSLMSRGIEREILPFLKTRNVGVTAYGVLSRGLLVGTVPDRNVKSDIRVSRLPRFNAENLEPNLNLAKALAEIARELGISAAQASIAWALSRYERVVPVIGARRPDRLEDALTAAALSLSAQELEAIANSVPAERVSGTRYDQPQMGHVSVE